MSIVNVIVILSLFKAHQHMLALHDIFHSSACDE